MTTPLPAARLAEIRERARRMIADRAVYASLQYAEDYGLLLAEVDRLAVESEQRHGELLFWHFEFQDAMDNYRGEAQHVKKLAAESESRRQAAAANAASIEVLQRQINEQASELDRLRAELAAEQAKVRAVETVKCWVNEDRQRFVFAEDLAFALGYTPTDAAPAEPTCGVLNPKVAATCTEPTEHPSPIHRDAFGNTWYRREGERPLAADPFEGHFEHCYIREGAHCSCGHTTPAAPTT